MKYLALYRKYRPDKFEDIAGQQFIVKTLKNSITNGKISHAYLFSGPRGTGKTTIAKLIAKLINCTGENNNVPCETCPSCVAFNEKNHPDIIEMDAASNNGVDEIREIRDNVNLLPVLSSYKIYIIDEVHMLSSGAFNALLKTLEEPPRHVIFILATTEFYKVPETIVSRCQCYQFDRISNKDIVKKLKYISNQEKISVSDETLELIAKYSDGGLRDAIGMLDKLYCISNNISVNDFYDLKGIVNNDVYTEIINLILTSNLVDFIKKIDELFENGKNIILLADGIMHTLKNIIIEKVSNNLDSDVYFDLINVFNSLIINIKNSSNPKIIFETSILKFMNDNKKIISREIILNNNIVNDNNCNDILENIDIINNNNVTKSSTVNKDDNVKPISDIDNESNNKIKFMKERNKIRINNSFATADKNLLNKIKTQWNRLNEYLHNPEFSMVVSFLFDATLRVVGSENAILSFRYKSIVDNAYENIGKIELLFSFVSDKMYKIAFVSDEEWNYEKNQYIDNKKNGFVYSFIEEKQFNDIISENVPNNNDKLSEVSTTAINLFGNDLVEIKK